MSWEKQVCKDILRLIQVYRDTPLTNSSDEDDDLRVDYLINNIISLCNGVLGVDDEPKD